jgi:hypothetical protein
MTPPITRCKWAHPTLFSDWPYWLDAWTWPWACGREGGRPLVSGCESCRNCPNWDSGIDGLQGEKGREGSEACTTTR